MMVAVSGYAEFIIPPDKRVIVSSSAIAWTEIAPQTHGAEAAIRHSGRFDIEGIGEASLEVYEYTQGVFSYRTVTLPDGCDCVSMFSIEA